MKKISTAILISDPRYNDPLPFLVEVWDNENNERDEERERAFLTLAAAKRYAKKIGPLDEIRNEAA